jgi:sialic acid synthase SpsE
MSNNINFLFKKKTTPYIIAEIGINHDGKFKKAKKLIRLAKDSGASAVKFQLFKAEDLYIQSSKNFKIVKKLEISFKNIEKLRKYSKKINISFICTPFSIKAALFLKKIKVDAIKIASMDANNFVLISKCIGLKLPLIISTGMCDRLELIQLNKKLIALRANKIIIMHCLSNYPCKINDVNLNSIKQFKKIFSTKYKIGYSDHTIGITACLNSIFQGAEVIEKHFTDKKSNNNDHIHSADSFEIKILSSFAKDLLKTSGEENFFRKRKDLNNRKIFRRGVYASKNIVKFTKLTEDKINFVRPQNKSNLSLDKNLFAKKILKNVKKNKQINKKDINNN